MRRLLRAIMVLGVVMAPCAQAQAAPPGVAPPRGGDVADLPPLQRTRAACMLAVLGNVRSVSKPSLHVSGDVSPAGFHTFLTYTYHHRDRRISPSVSSETIEITDLISQDQDPRTLILGGVTPIGGDLDDMDSGMLRISLLWRVRCGLKLLVITG